MEDGIGLFVLIVVAALIFIVVSLATGRRGDGRRGSERTCSACGAGHPHFAQFCRRCGQRLQDKVL